MISIIVPVYNVEKYLEACIDSILNSTFTDYELILVDDGSTDRSGVICDEYHRKDQRVVVIHQSNAGVSCARNAGLDCAIGEYVSFIDGDDVIHPEMLELLLDMISSGDYDMSMVLNQKIDFAEREHFLAYQRSELGNVDPQIMSQGDFFKAMFTPNTLQISYGGPCHKLFKRKLLYTEDGRYLEFKPIPAEDTEWLTRVVLGLKKYIMIPLNLYFYVERSDSLTHSNSEHMINDIVIGRLGTLYQCFNLIPKDMPEFRSMCLKDIYVKIQYYTYLAQGTTYERTMREECRKIYKNTINEYLHISSVSFFEKAKNMMYFYCPWIYRAIIEIGALLVKCKIIKN